MSHGSSPASWTAVIVCLLGFLIGGLALIPNPSWIFFAIGCVLVLGGGIVGWIMSAAGLGADRANAPEPEPEPHQS